MIRAAVDLHMHSALSPCGDEMMTPGNIVGMAAINGLHAIAVTDHNSSQNVRAAVAIGKAMGVVVVPGMELESVEEIHVVCLFKTIEALEAFQKIVDESYVPAENRPEIFGDQLIFNENDEPTGALSHMLLSPTGISIDDVFSIADRLDGIAYPAHVDRDSYSVLTSFGTLPYGYALPFVEISCDCTVEQLLLQYPLLEQYRLLRASDAHYIDKIQEAVTFIEVETLSAAGVVEALKKGRIVS